MIDVNDAAKARLARMTTMKKLNPTFSISDAAAMNSFIEQSFYLSVFGDPYTGVARSDWVQSWFGESESLVQNGVKGEADACIATERLPTSLGWMPRALETNLTTLMPMAKRVQAATPATVVAP